MLIFKIYMKFHENEYMHDYISLCLKKIEFCVLCILLAHERVYGHALFFYELSRASYQIIKCCFRGIRLFGHAHGICHKEHLHMDMCFVHMDMAK